MKLGEIGCENVIKTDVSRDSIQLKALIFMQMNIRVP